MATSAAADPAISPVGAAARPRIVRLLGTTELGLGGLLALRSRWVAALAAGSGGQPAPRWVVRVLGVRSLVQGAVTTAAPARTVLVGGAMIDATHAATMLPLVAASPRHRRAAAISALIATAGAVAGVLAAGRAQPGRDTAT
jgi:hypothetical protein